MADEYIEAATDADMKETELAMGQAHDASGALPLMGPRVYGSNCEASKLVPRQERLTSFRRHANDDGEITKEGGVLLVTPEVDALAVGDVMVDGKTVRLDVPSLKLLRADLTEDGQKLVDDIEAKATLQTR